jgi:hypothetical protein
MSKKLILKDDFIIPKGSVFDCIDNTKREWIEGNYETMIAINDCNTGHFIINDDSIGEMFNIVED